LMNYRAGQNVLPFGWFIWES